MLQIRKPHKRFLLNEYSSSNYMNNKTAMYFPKMTISGLQHLNINKQSIILSCSYDGNINAWSIPHCAPIIKHNDDDKDNDENMINDTKFKEIISRNGDIYDKLMIDICHKICNKLETEIDAISNELNVTPKRITSFGIASDPNGLLLGLIHPVTNTSTSRLSHGLQKLHLYPVSTDYQIIYHSLLAVKDHYYFQPVSIAILLDYFRSYHIKIIKEFIQFCKTTFSHWFTIVDVDDDNDDDDDEDLEEDYHINIDDILKQQNSLRFCLLMLKYFVSRIQPFDGMENNQTLEWLNNYIRFIVDTLLQLHCYKTLKSFLMITSNRKHDIDMKNEDEIEFIPPSDEETKEEEYLTIYLMFIWNAFNYIHNQNENQLTKIYNFLHNTLLIQFETVFERLQDNNHYEKCHFLRKCLYPDDFDDDDDISVSQLDVDQENKNTKRFTMNCKKMENCPICNKLTTVTMHGGRCGSDNDEERHLISRCYVSFKIINDRNRLHCSCCNAGITKYITQQLLNGEVQDKEEINDNIDIMTKCFSHCLPFICSICNVPLVQVL